MHNMCSELGAVPKWMPMALVILGVVFAMALIGNKKARHVLKGLLALGGVVLFFGFFLLFVWRMTASRVGPPRHSASIATEVAPGVRIEQEGDEMIVAVDGKLRIEKEGDQMRVAIEGEEPILLGQRRPDLQPEKGSSGSPKAKAEKKPDAKEPAGSTSDRQAGSPEKQPPAEAPKKAVAEDPSPGPDERPEWVDWEEGVPYKAGKACQMRIAVGPYSTRSECNQKLPERLHEAIDQYVAVYAGPEAREKVRLPLDYIQSRLVQAEWPETVDIGIPGVSAIQLHVLLEFDHEANATITEQWDRAVVNGRLAGIGGLAAGVLLLLSAVYGYLKIDLATKGAYRGRLRLAATGLILILLSVAGFTLWVYLC